MTHPGRVLPARRWFVAATFDASDGLATLYCAY